MSIDYTLVDVFSARPYRGNSLPVFAATPRLGAAGLLRITQELRHFEAVFLRPARHADAAQVRVFDQHEELPFAGHPLLGAAAVLHHRAADARDHRWRLALPGRTVEVTTTRTGDLAYSATIDQGRPEFLGAVPDRAGVAHAVTLRPDDLAPGLPLEVAGTGLRYLVVPVTGDALARARVRADLTPLLHGHGAQFAVLFDPAGMEIRHWDNDGSVEDVATGSAAGVIAAYRLRHGLARSGETSALRQGRFTGRPARLIAHAWGTAADVRAVSVTGDVVLVGTGRLTAYPDDTEREARLPIGCW